jgi:hypothetical protein
MYADMYLTVSYTLAEYIVKYGIDKSCFNYNNCMYMSTNYEQSKMCLLDKSEPHTSFVVSTNISHCGYAPLEYCKKNDQINTYVNDIMYPSIFITTHTDIHVSKVFNVSNAYV